MRANLAAIRTAAQITVQQRSATAAEQQVLARWSGWGAVPQVFDDSRPEFEPVREQLRGVSCSARKWCTSPTSATNTAPRIDPIPGDGLHRQVTRVTRQPGPPHLAGECVELETKPRMIRRNDPI